LTKVVAAIQADHPEINVQCIIVRQPDGRPLFGEVVSDGPIPELSRLALRATIDLIYITEAWEAERSLKWTLAEICLKKG
jgi:hypothetical protein